MIITLKQLSQNNKIIAPQTVAEAVLVKNNDNVITLNKALSNKQDTILTPAGTGLVQHPQTNSVILTHSNNVEATDSLKTRLFKYDNHGHITESAEAGKIVIKLNNETILESGTIIDQSLNLGDDFKKEDDIIKLNWKEYGNS